MFRKLIDDVVARMHPYKTREQIESEVLAKRDQLGQEIAERFTRGNVNIKNGRFLTEDDLKARKAHHDN